MVLSSPSKEWSLEHSPGRLSAMVSGRVSRAVPPEVAIAENVALRDECSFLWPLEVWTTVTKFGCEQAGAKTGAVDEPR